MFISFPAGRKVLGMRRNVKNGRLIPENFETFFHLLGVKTEEFISIAAGS
jgi:hypothetical protein